MIPQRFVVEYPARCVLLLRMLEPLARENQLVGSFSLLVANSIFVIPFERMKDAHPLHENEREPEIYEAIRAESGKPFLEAALWNNKAPTDWRMSRIMTPANEAHGWKDRHGLHPMSEGAENVIGAKKLDDVVRVIRNALAHGNVIYLDKNGMESPGAQVRYLGFLSRYEESKEQRDKAETYRLVTTTEEGFLAFVKAWAAWLAKFGYDSKLVEGAN